MQTIKMVTPNFSREDIDTEISKVLAGAHKGKGDRPKSLTAYQVLNKIPDEMAKELEEKYGGSGKAAGTWFGAASYIAHRLLAMYRAKTVKIRYIDTDGMSFDVKGVTVRSGYPCCAIYQAALPVAVVG
jgi:hypothetical protein